MSDAPATTTADIATRDGVGFRRRKWKKKFKPTRFKLPGDKSEATYHGGKSMLRAWFGKGLLKRKKGKSKGASSTYSSGHKGRKYVVTKRGGGRYTIRRKKR